MNMYSDKVMEYFKNPKNVGEIKNADGIGKVGNPVCLLPDSLIQHNPNLVPIKDSKISDSVLSHDGEFNPIKRVIKRSYRGKIIKIKNRLGETVLTPEHECLAVKWRKTDHFRRINNKKKNIPDWHHASELEKEDLVLYPIIKKTVDVNKITTNVKVKKYDFKSIKIPEEIEVNNNFLRLAGYFLAEGYTRLVVCRTFAGFCFNSKEKDYINDVRNLIKKIFGIKAIIKESKNNSTNVIVNNVHVARIFRELFGNSALNKKVPEFMLFLPREKQKSLIEGLWKGDGYFNPKKPRAGFSTISKNLVQQLKILLLRQGIIPSVYTENEKKIRGVNHKKCYRIHTGDRDSLIKLADILKINFNCKIKPTFRAWCDDNFAYIPITKIISENYKGLVYNLEVENAHSFSTESLALHNCGDIMWIYIKVGKNKEGKEIIEDIKFKTFGCVAAISTSSVLTEMAKGKTLEEAEKITREDIVKELGGLPEQKIHCSVLGASALKDAIKDYRSRKKLS